MTDPVLYKPRGGLRHPRDGGPVGRPVGVERRRTAEVAARLTRAGETPLEKMVANAEYFIGIAQKYEAELARTTDSAAQALLENTIRAWRLCAQSCWRDCAPYVHPRLASHYVARDERRVVIQFEPGDETI